jgi:hypothetical protein
MKVTNQDKGKPGGLVVANTVYKEKRRSQFAVQFSWNGIHHTRQMNNGEKPKGTRHLFFVEISAGHVY